MRFKLFALAVVIFLCSIIAYQDLVYRELSQNLHWLVDHCAITQ